MSQPFLKAQNQLLRAIDALQSVPARVGPGGKSRQLVTATVGLVLIVVLPAIAVYYARRRWRP